MCRWIAGIFATFSVSILFLTLASAALAPRQAYRSRCASNLHQIGLALMMYSNGDPQGRFAPDFQSLITTQQLSPEVFVCPTCGDTPAPGATAEEQVSHLYDGGHESYVYTGACLTKDSPDDAISAYEPPENHHGDGGNVLFADGHVEYFKCRVLQRIIAMDRRGDRPIYWPPHRP